MGGKKSLVRIVSVLVAAIGIGCASVKKEEVTNASSIDEGAGIFPFIETITDSVELCILRDLDEVGEYSGVIEISGEKAAILTSNNYSNIHSRIALLREGNFSTIADLINSINESRLRNPDYYLVKNNADKNLIAQLEITRQSTNSGKQIKKHELEILCDLIASFFDGLGGNSYELTNNRITFHIHPNNTSNPSEADIKMARSRGHEIIFSYIPIRAIIKEPDSNIVIDKIETCIVLSDGSTKKRQYDVSPRVGHLLRIKTAKILATGYQEDLDLSLACLESFKEEKISDYHKDNLEEAVNYVGSRIINKILEAIDKSDKSSVDRYKLFFERYTNLCDRLKINHLEGSQIDNSSHISKMIESGLLRYSVEAIIALTALGIVFYRRRKKVKL